MTTIANKDERFIWFEDDIAFDTEISEERHLSHNQKSHGKGKGASVPSEDSQLAGADAMKQYATHLGSDAVGSTSDKVIAQHGKAYMFDESSIEGPRGKMHGCYENAGKAAMFNDMPYVEGYMNIHGVPVAHAWNLSPEGKVVDPTLRNLSGVQGYFGVHFSPKYVQDTIVRTKYWGLLGDMSGQMNARRILNGTDTNFLA